MVAARRLAARMRPRTLDEVVGQAHIIGPGKLLRLRAIEADRLFTSILFWGPPGTGKTTLAAVIANTTQSHFETLSTAVLAGVADLRKLVDAARELARAMYGTRTLLMVDEIHRWNKAQQDGLPYVVPRWHHHVDRRDDREPLLLDHLAAAQPLAHLSVRRAHGRGDRGAHRPRPPR